MRFALVYPDPISMELVQAIFCSGLHELSGAFAAGQWQDELVRHGVSIAAGPATEVLGTPALDAVIVGATGSADSRTELLRTLVQAEVPILVVHPVGDMLFGFELQMAQAATDVPILPFFPGMNHPFVTLIAGWLAQAESSPVGRVQHVEVSRQTTGRNGSAAETVFCRDAMLLRLLLGRILRVSSLRAWEPGPPDIPAREDASHKRPAKADRSLTSKTVTDEPGTPTGLQSWTVQMLDERGRVALWKMTGGTRDHAELTILGEQQKCVLEMVADPRSWVCTLGESRLGSPAGGAFDPYSAALDQMAAAIQAPARRQAANLLWEHACRSVELADAVTRSSRRGRAIELYHEEHSEESSFKGVMAAGGCLALMSAVAAIPLVAVGERLLPEPEPGSRWLRFPWVILLFALCFFLVLQLLRLAIKSSDG